MCGGYVITHDRNILGHWEKSIKTHFKNFMTNFEYNGPLFFYYILQIVSTVTCDVYVTYDKIVTSPLYYYHYYSLMILWSLRNSYTTTYTYYIYELYLHATSRRCRSL